MAAEPWKVWVSLRPIDAPTRRMMRVEGLRAKDLRSDLAARVRYYLWSMLLDRELGTADPIDPWPPRLSIFVRRHGRYQPPRFGGWPDALLTPARGAVCDAQAAFGAAMSVRVMAYVRRPKP